MLGPQGVEHIGGSGIHAGVAVAAQSLARAFSTTGTQMLFSCPSPAYAGVVEPRRHREVVVHAEELVVESDPVRRRRNRPHCRGSVADCARREQRARDRVPQSEPPLLDVGHGRAARGEQGVVRERLVPGGVRGLSAGSTIRSPFRDRSALLANDWTF